MDINNIFIILIVAVVFWSMGILKHIKLYTLNIFIFCMIILPKALRKKGIEIRNKVKWSSLADNMMVYIENAKYSMKQQLNR